MEDLGCGDGGLALLRLVEKATNSTDREVEPRLLKSIKAAVRSSDEQVRVAIHALMEKMRKEHSQVRYLSLLIIDELFMRSKLFRTLLVENFDQFLSLSVGFRRNLPLPPPAAVASLLQSKAIELLEKWNVAFGIYYRQLRLGFDYLKNTLRYQFPNRLENEARLQQERRERERRTQEILLNKFESFKENYHSIKSEIHSTLDQLGECLNIMNSGEDEITNSYPVAEDDDGFEFNNSSLLRQIRIDALKEARKIHESSDNKAVFDALKELHKLLVSKHLRTVQDNLSLLVRVDLSDNSFRDSALKELIDMRNLIHSATKRCQESASILHTDDQDDDLWEEGKVEKYDAECTSMLDGFSSFSNDQLNITNDKGKTSLDQEFLPGASSSCEDGSTSVRSKLLSEAPVLTWGSFLDSWGENRDALANHRGLELENHWGRVDPDATIPANKIAELNFHLTTYKEPAIELQPCLAPLKKGGLCQRRDIRTCPFHGPIIPRDTQGNPIDNNTAGKKPLNETDNADELSTKPVTLVDSEVNHGSSNELENKLAKQAIKNVRQRDNDEKALKRAKLAKVRQHNEVVLREAAVASTSHSESFNEDREMTHQYQTGVKSKKPTLTSMLRKKITTKDRLAQRLLSARVTDAAVRQLTQGDDAKYRESYPNQW